MKKGDIVEFRRHFPDEEGVRYMLIEEPEGDRVLAVALLDLVIKPTYVLKIEDIKLFLSNSKNNPIQDRK